MQNLGELFLAGVISLRSVAQRSVVWLCTFAGTRELVQLFTSITTHLRGVAIAYGDPWLCILKPFDMLGYLQCCCPDNYEGSPPLRTEVLDAITSL
jgi:hypothetical protein